MENSQSCATEKYILSPDQICGRYLEICEALSVSPPAFLIKAADEMKSDGMHLPHGDGTFSIYLSDEMRSPRDVDTIIIHELSHHALHLAGYTGTGHAWVMLATERILFRKASVNFNSIIWDAQNNWPKHIFWGVWLKHVQHAYDVVEQHEGESELLSKSAVDIASWVLQQHAPFEGIFGRHWFWKKPMAMYHTIISDRRSVQILARWATQAALLIGFATFVIADHFALVWLKHIAAWTVGGTLFVAMLFIGLADIYNKTLSFAKNIWRKVAKFETVFNTK